VTVISFSALAFGAAPSEGSLPPCDASLPSVEGVFFTASDLFALLSLIIARFLACEHSREHVLFLRPDRFNANSTPHSTHVAAA